MTATFTVSVSTTAHDGVTFSIATADGGGIAPATAGDDYVARAEPVCRFPPVTTSYSFAVAINGDTSVEPDETFPCSSPMSAARLSGGRRRRRHDRQRRRTATGRTDVVISQVYGGGGN